MVIMPPMSSSNGGIGRGEVSSFIQQVVFGRWFSVFASFLIMTGAGGTYLFAYYSKDIKTALQCNQTTLNMIGFYKDLGSNFGVLAGLLSEIAPTWFVLLVGAALNFLGYFKIWQAVTGKIGKPTVRFICFYIFMGANAQNFANTAALVTSVKNFPERRGVMLGLLKGFVGLSGAIMTQLYLAIYGKDSKSLILLIGWLPTVISLVFITTIKESKIEKHPNEFRVLYQFLLVSILLALFLTVLIIVQRHTHFSQLAQSSSAMAVLALLLLPLLIAIREEMVLWNLHKRSVNPFARIRNEKAQSPQIPSGSDASDTLQELKESTSCFADIFKKPERGEDYTILQAIFSIDMLIIFITTLTGVGASLTAIDNLGQIGESLHYPAETINSFISLVSIFNFFGRIFSGFVSEILLTKYKFPRPLMLTLVLLVSCIGHLFIAFPFYGSVYIASVIVGFSLGSQVPLLFAIISEIFGLKHYAILFNFGQLACPIGSYILNVMVTGRLYDEGARIGIDYSGVDRGTVLACFGSHCYQKAFTIFAALTFFGAMVSLILVQRTTEFYRGDPYKKFREDLDSLKTEVVFYRVDEKKTRIGNLLFDKHSINYVR